MAATVDDEDYGMLSRHRWQATYSAKGDCWYAQRTTTVDGRRRTVLMHRVILGLTDPRVMGDHKNHDGLDNRRLNLRPCDNSANQGNGRKRSGGSSRYKGVSWAVKDARWIAQIQFHGVNRRLGSFLVEEDAARAYDEAALEQWGEFAVLNRSSHRLTSRRAA